MRRMILTSSLLLALSTLSTTALAGQVYKWVDAQGVTHFGAQPPEGQQATSINTAIAPAKPAAAKPATTFDSDTDAEQEAIDRQVKQQVAEQQAKRKEYCQTVRTNLAQLENNPRLRVEVDGEVRRLNEEERQQRIGETKKAIADNCQ
ncbi:DUF4124 domain-containing protein [Pseudomonas zhanjiangensis]|uniref:DUF4124 domain-containing protein n=1 Tax=Pseudomonas zhanjiangensis TaxID=3239015 RepID=A0ABV3YXC2_9PSED